MATKFYYGTAVTQPMIRRYAKRIAERFRPERIILFGSHAYGTLHAESDVDLLVVMRCRNQLDQCARISIALEAPFPLDIVVRTPYAMKWRLREGDGFLREIVNKGKVLYEATDDGVGAKGRGRLRVGAATRQPASSRA